MDAHGESLTNHLELTSRDAQEAGNLLDALSIGSTSFFRDPLSFVALQDSFRGRSQQQVRAWVAGCSTGEEAYLLAMLLLEVVARRGESRRVRVYATDVRPSSLDVARGGRYAAEALRTVSPERVARFFIREEGSYRVSKELREAVVFGRHDVLADPPFRRLDLLSCRNVLLSLHEDAQRRVLERFHFGLHTGACLFSGPTESPRAAPGLFRVHAREHRLYRKLPRRELAQRARKPGDA